MFETIATIAVVVTGLLVGVELCVAVFVNPIVDPLPADGGLAARSNGARLLGRVMPFWYFASVVLSIATAVTAGGGQATVLSVVAAALLVVTIILAVTVLVPINDRVKEWSTGDHPADWRDQLQHWDRWHVLRVALILVGFTLLVVAGIAV